VLRAFLVHDNLIDGDERRAALARRAARVHFSAEIGESLPGHLGSSHSATIDPVGATHQSPPRQPLADKSELSPAGARPFTESLGRFWLHRKVLKGKDVSDLIVYRERGMMRWRSK
jgi:hypothetical protein